MTFSNGTPAIDTASPAGLIQDHITLVACPAPSCKNMSRFTATFSTPQHQHHLAGNKALASQSQYVCNVRGAKETKEDVGKESHAGRGRCVNGRGVVLPS